MNLQPGESGHLNLKIFTFISRHDSVRGEREETAVIPSADNDNLAADLLRGADAIAAYLGFPPRAIYHAVSRKQIPHFRVGETICGRKSTLKAWIIEQEQAARARA